MCRNTGSVQSLVDLEPEVGRLRHGHGRRGRRRRRGRGGRGCHRVAARGHGGGPRPRRGGGGHHDLFSLDRLLLLVLFLLVQGSMTKFRRIRTLAKCAAWPPTTKAGTARTFPPPSSFRLSFLVLVRRRPIRSPSECCAFARFHFLVFFYFYSGVSDVSFQ